MLIAFWCFTKADFANKERIANCSPSVEFITVFISFSTKTRSFRSARLRPVPPPRRSPRQLTINLAAANVAPQLPSCNLKQQAKRKGIWVNQALNARGELVLLKLPSRVENPNLLRRVGLAAGYWFC